MKKVLKGDVLSTPTPERPRNKQSELRLVVPETLRADMLHYSHEGFQGGHQGINRTFERLRSEFYWFGINLWESVWIVRQPRGPPVLGPSPGNIEQRYPFEGVCMDFATDYLRPIVEIPTCCCSKINSQDTSCANPCGIPKPKML
ncbi:reverse transcriptase [Phytophthora megakarya]|uniref:Reverse transcriptase n=1 Tax=Phytophthora megakarya TaxID=4795 RepID=A0A225WGK6_9STRA|nr:reverse transcriptase [Phytophthora megakarya]